MSTEPERRAYTPGQLFNLALALHALSEAFLADKDALRVDLAVEKTLRYLNEFVGEVKETPKLTESEANFSGAAHTYMRKCMDGPLSTLLYNHIAANRGIGAWYAFIEGVMAKPRREEDRYRNGLRSAEAYYDAGVTIPEDREMICLLELWGQEDFDVMIDSFKRDNWGVKL